MRIGILIGSLERGGAQQMAMRLLDGFVQAGVEAFILTLDKNSDLLDDAEGLPPETRRRFIRLSGSDVRRPAWTKIAYAPWQWIQLVRKVRSLELDVVLSFMERANILMLTLPGPVRRIISIRSHYESLLAAKAPLKRLLIEWSYPFLLERAGRITFNSTEAAAGFAKQFPQCRDRLAVIPNACDVNMLRERARQPLGAEEQSIFDRPVIITCGRLIKEKGHAPLIRAFAQVAGRDPKPRLVILGSGPMEPELRALCRQLRLDGRILLPGYQSNPFAWLKRATLFVLPSLREGFPNALLEAMALGLPVIAADCRSGPREMLAPDTDPVLKTASIEEAPFGLLLPSFNECKAAETETLWAQAMSSLLDDAAKRQTLARNAARRAADFCLKRSISEWLALAAWKESCSRIMK